MTTDMHIIKAGDRVRHKSGWEATVVEVTDRDTLKVFTEEVHLRGEYAAGAFKPVEEAEDGC
jgi:hypothetical protein